MPPNLSAGLFEEHDPHPPLFDRLENTIPQLATKRREEVFLAFQVDLLRESGYLPELFACVSCGISMEASPANGSSNACYFSASQGGIICRNCEGVTPD